MKIFVTGASGWIGSAVVPELLESGHDVVGLARSDASSEKLEAAGATVQRGDLDDPETLAKAANDADGVIHLAFQHEIAFGQGDFAAAGAADRRAVEAMGAALAGSDRPFVLASGVAGLTFGGRPATEADGLVPSAVTRAAPPGIRQATALLALSLRGLGVRSSGTALRADGPRRRRQWVHRDVRRRRPGEGRVGLRGRRRAPLAGRAPLRCGASRPPRRRGRARRLGAPRRRRGGRSLPRHRRGHRPRSRRPDGVHRTENTLDHFGPLGLFAGMDFPATAAITRELLGWRATGPTLIEDLDEGHYFRQA